MSTFDSFREIGGSSALWSLDLGVRVRQSAFHFPGVRHAIGCMLGSMPNTPLVTPESLAPAEARRGVVFVDARTGPDARERYQAEHLVDAVFVDLAQDLSAPPDPSGAGGRHPLPSPLEFTKLLQWLGVGPHVRVVVYDDQSGANAAARFWWMMHAIGQPNVQVLDGGIQAAKQAGIPTESASGPRPTVRHLDPVSQWSGATANLEEVLEAAKDPSRRVIDVRGRSRYRGESDPFETPGHIPGAWNFPYAELLGPDGRFLPAGELNARLDEIQGGLPAESLIIQCGSGVTACETLLAFAVGNRPLPKLYVGSYSEYARSGRPIAQGESR
jgi:thiosulfate/3-mercaptopyruvate sulfurtransferase